MRGAAGDADGGNVRRHLFYIAISIALLATNARASDHADPAWLSNNRQEANLTGLFFFPVGDRYVAILNTRPTLTAPPPYNLKPYTFTIDIDTHSAVRFPPSPPPLLTPPLAAGAASPTATAPVRASAEAQMLNGDFARYGGTVVNPAGIGPDVSFTFALENDATLRPEKLNIVGLDPQVAVQVFNDSNLFNLRTNPDAYKNSIWIYTGVRDDPFIFPKFFNANIVTMIVSVPKSAFRTTSQDWLLWGVSKRARNGEKIDHVGRSNRTQLGRFDILNTAEPNRHVKMLRDATAARVKVQDFLKEVLRPASNLNQLSGFLLRNYDYAPDVMIFSTRYPAHFPNGRQLEDDVARITCDNGDCPLQENSYIDSKAYPRTTKNDKPFLTDFPYLAERWAYRPQPFTGSPWHWFSAHLLWPLVLIVTLFLAFRVWRRRTCARLRTAAATQSGEIA